LTHFAKRFFLSCICLISLIYSQAQNYTLRGTIQDITNKEYLIGATIINQTDPAQGTATNTEGKFQLKLKPGQYTFKVAYLGYREKLVKLTIQRDTSLRIMLKPDAVTTGEVLVSEEKSDKNIKSAEMSRVQLNAKTLNKLPVLFGEVDPLKSITLLPGIQSGGEGNTGIYVRGGGPDQNLVLLDDCVVYNASHLLGFFSVFNGDVVQNVEVIKGGMPAEYGGRLSSIISIETREGNREQFKANGGIGLISSRLTMEGPIQKGKSSFLVSGRRTYADIVAQPLFPDSLKGNRLYFYDLNGKVSFLLSEKDKLSFNAYFGRDAFRYYPPDRNDLNFKVSWGNALVSANYVRQINTEWSLTSSLSYNDFNLGSQFEFDQFVAKVSSGLQDWTQKTRLTYSHNNKSTVKFGYQYIFHTFQPGILNAEVNGEDDLNSEINQQYAHEGALFAGLDQDLNVRFHVNLGLRYSFFNQVGPYDQVVYEQNGIRTDQIIKFTRGESIAFWDGFEPRASLRYTINSTQSIKASYTRTLQYLHLATSSAATLPSDLWIPSSAKVKPQIADQFALGYFKNFKENQYESSVELYYKPMQNQIEFRPGADLFFNQNLESEIVSGQGRSYGIEFFFKKAMGKTTGWIGYTWSKSERKFESINDGDWYYYRYDRRHDISLVITHELNKKWDFNFVFVYATGNVITLPVGRFAYNLGVDVNNGEPFFSILDLYTDANTFRMPAYHRADISATWTPSAGKEKRFVSSWNFSIYNVYNRKNPYFIYLDADQVAQSVGARMVYLFPILPSVTWNFKF